MMDGSCTVDFQCKALNGAERVESMMELSNLYSPFVKLVPSHVDHVSSPHSWAKTIASSNHGSYILILI